MPDIQYLARCFVNMLRKELGEEQWQEMIRRNQAETDLMVCHSHDFCDPNQVMIDLLDEELGLDASEHVNYNLVNLIWDEALFDLGRKLP